MRKKLSLRVCLLAAVLAASFAAPAAASSFASKTSSGGRAYWLFVPTSYSAGNAAPLVVLLHGCTQTGDGFATSTGMNGVAEEKGFLVAYPVQPGSANASSCWNWFLPAHQARGAGEPASLAGVVTHVKSQYTIDNAKVYLAGFSAGGAMASILGATYPDVFAAIGVHSGLEFKAATTQNAAFTAMSSGGPDPTAQGNAAYAAMGSFAQQVRVVVFHGTSDFTVATVNGNQALSQWAQTNDRAADGADNNDVDDAAEITQGGQVPGASGRTYTRTAYQDANGNVVLEKYLVDGMGHNWSGGPLGGAFTDPNGPSASRLMADFFLGTSGGGGGPGDTTPPITTASPAGGSFAAPVSVTLAVDESANTFYTTNGTAPNPSSPLYTSPIPIDSDATLRYFSIDLAGNAEALKQQVYVIDTGGGGGGATFTSLDGEDGFAGALAADGLSTTVHKAGDKGMFNGDTFRLLLSFDTSSVPAAATITGATLTITRQSLSGAVTSLTVDAADLFGAAALARSDYGAAADVSSAATLAVPSANGGSSSVGLPSSTYNLIKTGKLQLRIKAAAAIDFTTDVLTVYGGDAGAQAPKLVVTWQ